MVDLKKLQAVLRVLNKGDLEFTKEKYPRFMRTKSLTKPKNIFFLEPSGRCHLTTKESCSLESAAKHHPANKIQLLYVCKNLRQLKDDKPFQIVSQIEHVEIKSLNFTHVFSGTPLVSWYESGILNVTKKRTNDLSDGLKFVLFKKYGGVTIDSDCIISKPLPNLYAYAGFQTLPVVNNAIIKARKDSPFLVECMQRFVKEYSPSIWCHNGPSLLTRETCGNKYKYFAPGFTCYGIDLFPVPAFYAVHFSQLRLFSDPNVSEFLKEITN
ncbi:lactosylceramide 4-alpha-galactosyltransferase-like [Tachypleus tridentatus]|uniref:lactosylceramide 4-alpha-galactosyltransferase-like n=1 Tax=Tachypleus tridentatus TaxID=6853 RepID=UPI003FD4E45A